jgi:hypothetical protein
MHLQTMAEWTTAVPPENLVPRIQSDRFLPIALVEELPPRPVCAWADCAVTMFGYDFRTGAARDYAAAVQPQPEKTHA